MENLKLQRAYRYCEWIAYHHYENFPVASLLLPKEKRPHVAAVYAFARSADDFADEARYQGRSLGLLDEWRKALWACSGKTNGHSWRGGISPEHPIFLALANSIRECNLSVQLLDDLLTAFSMDVTKRRYADWEEVLTYCRYSANPVGRLVLTIFGYQEPELHALSDKICTGLQLANHWQDLGIDLAKDLLYIPQTDLRAFGVTEGELVSFLSGEPVTGNFRALLKELVDRADALFVGGESLPSKVRGSLRLELRITGLGGRAILAQIRKGNYDPFSRRPKISTYDKVRLLGRGLVS
jgi:squalene synthase HpnC